MADEGVGQVAGALEVLDPVQLRRIEATHRGFLYQHLCVVGALLQATEEGVRDIVVEGDEDLQLTGDGSELYVQVKTRARPLTFGDIGDTLPRFDAIRRARKGKANLAFAIVSNVAPGPALAEEIRKDDWPQDVSLLSPGGVTATAKGLPPAWASVEEAVAWCEQQARKVPYSRLIPTTLVWKLAAIAQLAASGGTPPGGRPHTFVVAASKDLFELVVRELRKFPPPPRPYRAHVHEPSLDSVGRVRLIVGPSGAGKTAWSAQAAENASDMGIYFDVSDVSADALPAALAYEVAAHAFGGDRDTIANSLRPGPGGFDALRRFQ